MNERPNYPTEVSLVEVGPRDGLQNEKSFVPTHVKLELIKQLIESGLKQIEVTSFVSPKWVPQMADHSEVLQGISGWPECNFSVLTPNLKGFENALACGAKEVAVFAAASESFSQKNINCSIDQSIERFKPLIHLAKEKNIRVRGYISCVLGCPYEGNIQADKVAHLAKTLIDLGCYQISLGDTIGKGNPESTRELITSLSHCVPIEQLAVHFHDTYGMALANILVALQMGIQTIDASVSGLGGCPYAKGASGNVATEDVVYLLDSLKIKSNIDLDKLVNAGDYINQYLGRVNRSKVATAILAQTSH